MPDLQRFIVKEQSGFEDNIGIIRDERVRCSCVTMTWPVVYNNHDEGMPV